jgi:hypothetical protein
MRASIPGGRFSVPYEMDSYSLGIDEELQRTVGGELPWWRFDPDVTGVDEVYTTGSDVESGGRRFKTPRALKYIVAQIFQGQTVQSDRGFYNADNLRLTVNMADFIRVFPDIVPETDSFLRDRAVFNGKAFRPTRVYLRGRVTDRYTIVTMDLVEVKGEELLHDPQFQWAVE